MDSSAQPDRLSTLPDVLLFLIISCLPFKQCVQTSLLSKRWKSLYREMKNVSFKESDFLTPSDYANPSKYDLARIDFIAYVRDWVDGIGNEPIDTFGISISNPNTHLDAIKYLINFAVRKKVKNLVLDFSHPAWRTFNNVDDLVFEIPKSVYDLTTLESLQVGACKNFDPSRLSKPGKLRSVSFGWMELTNLESWLKTSRLESLTINHCAVTVLKKLEGDMREVAIKNCDFLDLACTFELPRVDIFKYSGDIFPFEFDNMNTIISQVELDFGVLDNKHDQVFDPTSAEGGMLCEFLNKLLDNGRRTATTLTVCPFLLKMISWSEHPHFLRPMKTKHLVLKTRLHPKEFSGIRLLLKKCPNLETLTIDLLSPRPIATASSYAGIDPKIYWMYNISFKCLRETLKVVVGRSFVGGATELNIVKCLILRSGGEPGGHMLERVELYMPFDLDSSQKMSAYAKSEMLQQSSNQVQVSCAQLLKK